jgi:hypothetical protein
MARITWVLQSFPKDLTDIAGGLPDLHQNGGKNRHDATGSDPKAFNPYPVLGDRQ